VETPVSENVNLREEHAAIKRRPVDREATPEELNALKDESIEIRETAEKAVVSKTARVVEEVEVDTEESTNTETINDTVRSTEVDIERQNQKNRTDNRPNQPV
jgi:stress response protein YsnF